MPGMKKQNDGAKLKPRKAPKKLPPRQVSGMYRGENQPRKKPTPRQMSATYRSENKLRREINAFNSKGPTGLSKAMKAEQKRNKKRGNRPI